MTAAELIERLSQVPGDTPVLLSGTGDGPAILNELSLEEAGQSDKRGRGVWALEGRYGFDDCPAESIRTVVLLGSTNLP